MGGVEASLRGIIEVGVHREAHRPLHEDFRLQRAEQRADEVREVRLGGEIAPQIGMHSRILVPWLNHPMNLGGSRSVASWSVIDVTILPCDKLFPCLSGLFGHRVLPDWGK
jgi:hypothetical protein